MIKLINSYKLSILLILLIVGWIMILLIESSQPPLPILGTMEGLDKVAHFLAFSVLGLLLCGLSFKLSPKPVIPLFSMPLLIVTLSGIIEESYQMFIPRRASDLLDLLADVCGALFAIMLFNGIARLIRSNNRISTD